MLNRSRAPIGTSTPTTTSSSTKDMTISTTSTAAKLESKQSKPDSQAIKQPERPQTEELEEEPEDPAKRVAMSQALSPGLNLTSDLVTQPVATTSTEEETARQLAKLSVDSTVAAGGATETPTTTNVLQSHSSREVPLGEASLLGVSHILIPVSTMELFFRRFDMLQEQLDELKSLMSKSPDSRSVHPLLSNGGAAVDVANLTARVSALEGGLANHSGVLDETSTNTRLLLDATEGLKDDLKKVHGEIEGVHSACRALDTKLDRKLDSGPPPTVNSLPGSTPDSGTYVDRSPRSFLASGGAGVRDETTECRELVINGVLRNNYEISQESLFNIAFATLSTVYPSLGTGDIESARALQPQGPIEESSGVREEGLGHRLSTPPLCIARLTSARLVREVMRAKRALANNYLSTSAIKPVLLDPDSAACMPNRKIFINEMLPSEKFQAFKSLRSIAQGLGFKYIWHAGGRFLVRRKGGERAHVFVTAADLQAIRTACQPASKQHPPNKKLNNNASERQEAAQASESAQAS